MYVVHTWSNKFYTFNRLKIRKSLRHKTDVDELPLPCRLQNLIGLLFTQTIRCSVPDPENLRDFVVRPQLENVRLHCTMIRHSPPAPLEEPSNEGASATASTSAAAGSTAAQTGTAIDANYSLTELMNSPMKMLSSRQLKLTKFSFYPSKPGFFTHFR